MNAFRRVFVRRLSTRAGWVSGLLALALTGPAHGAVTLTASPAQIAWNSNAWVSVAISNVAVSGAVTLSLYVDVNTNGAIDAVDRLIQQFALRDGVANPLGARTIVDDEDGAANGVVRARISYHGLTDEAWISHAVAPYLWQATSTAGTSPATSFRITQSAGTTWLTGRVIDAATSNGIPGALVVPEPFAAHVGFLPATYTGPGGYFRLDLPAGHPAANIRAIQAVAPNAFMAETDQADQPFSTVVLTSVPAAGANPLPRPLRVLYQHGWPPEVLMVTGHVYDQRTNALAGVWVQAEGNDDDSDVWSLAISGPDGAFALPFVRDMPCNLYALPGFMTARGLIAHGTPLTITQDTAGVRVFCPDATVLAKVRVVNTATSAGVPGAQINLGDDESGGVGCTLPDGYAEIGVVPGSTYEAEMEERAVAPRHLLTAPSVQNLTVTAPGPFTNVTFHISSGYTLGGRVTAADSGQPLTGGSVALCRPWTWEFVADDVEANRANLAGDYELLAPTGTYRVVAQRFTGYLDGAYSNLSAYAWSDNGAAGDPVELTPAGRTGIDFQLDRGAEIRGRVTDAQGNGLRAHVSAFEDRYDWRAGGDTQNDGTYVLYVPEGTTYVVRAECDNYLTQYHAGQYEHLIDRATLVTATVAQPANGVDFRLLAPSYVEGRITDALGAGIADADVEIRWCPDRENNPWDDRRVASARSAADGYYRVPSPPGTNFLAQCQPPDGSFYIPETWSNATDNAGARLFNVADGATVSNVNFVLETGFRVTGRVTDENGQPLANYWVEAFHFNNEGNWTFDGGNSTDNDGNYGIACLPGTNHYVVATEDENAWYPRQYHSLKFNDRVADPIRAAAGETVSGVDFQMRPGYRIEGFVRRSDGSTPAGNGQVSAMDTNQFWLESVNADSSGWYRTMPLPTNETVAVRGQASDCESEYHDNTYAFSNATRVVGAPFGTLRIDFQLYGNNEDSDGDGMRNWWEDTRPDGVYNPAEDWASAWSKDTDGDHVEDNSEHGLNTSPKLADTDGDGQNDYAEAMVLGTRANDTNSCLQCLAVERAGDDAVVQWSSVPGRWYWVQRCTNLVVGKWDNVAGPLPASGGDTTSCTVTGGGAFGRAHYRVRVPYTW